MATDQHGEAGEASRDVLLDSAMRKIDLLFERLVQQEATVKKLSSDFEEARSRAISPWQLDNLVHMASALGVPKEELLQRALNLYALAVDESRRGNRLAVLNPEDEIVREVVGVVPGEEPRPLPAGRKG